VRGLRLCSLLFAAVSILSAQEMQELQKRITEFTLANGLRMIVLERHDSPVISFHTWVNAGSVNDPAGQSGMAHILEHLTYKGSEILGTRNWGEEKKALDAAEDALNKAEAEARVKRVTDKAKARAEARVTKPAEELRTETETETEGATTRTKAGAFTMGEGEEMPARAAPAQPSKQPSKMQTGARKESRDHTKLTPTSGQIARVSQHIELTRNPLAVTPGLESTRSLSRLVSW